MQEKQIVYIPTRFSLDLKNRGPTAHDIKLHIGETDKPRTV